MNARKIIGVLALLMILAISDSCRDVLEPEPIDLIINDVVLNEPRDIPIVEIGLYSAFRSITPNLVIAGDLTADNLTHIGTFTQYRELGVKKITSANASATALWGSIYGTIYIANFMIERIPEIPGVTATVRDRALATAHFLRGMSYFFGVYSFGGIPLVTTSNIEDNRNIPRASREEIIAFVEAEILQALGKLPETTAAPAFVSDYAVRAALSRFYLYQANWALAESYASQVIQSNRYHLDTLFSIIVEKDFPIVAESIFEVGYTIADDPATLNTLFRGRREIIPSNEEALALYSTESGDRKLSMTFDPNNQKGSDNGLAVAKYGTAVDDNNNIFVFRLGEIYLIRAEARAHQGNTSGAGSAQEDINALRVRANAPTVGSLSQSQMLQIIENERRYELAFEGHRWYDLVRTGRVEQVMPLFNSNWRPAFQLWPIPQREIQSNPGLADSQNPGY